MKAFLWLPLSLAATIYAQTCENYGTPNGNDCSCPTGFGGSSCSEVACRGTLFQGRQRTYTNTNSGFANLTAQNCGCESGWGGVGCNVCTESRACQSAFAASGAVSANSTSLDGVQNSTLVCNTSPRAYAASQMSCSVEVSIVRLCDTPF